MHRQKDSEKTTSPASLERLRWQCRRGMLELDLLLKNFLENTYPGLDTESQVLFVTLLEYPDPVLQEWLLDPAGTPEPKFMALVEKIKDYHPA